MSPGSARVVGVSGVLLAAGCSTRFGGGSKALASFLGTPVVVRLIKSLLASGLDEVLVVAGHQEEEVLTEVRQAGLDSEVRWVSNPDFRTGQSASVRAGVRAVSAASGGALFVPVDQPMVSPEVIDQLIDAFEVGEEDALVPLADGHRRAPVLFSHRLFGELSRLEGDRGGRQLLARDDVLVKEVAVANALALEDFDTREELGRLESAARSSRPSVFEAVDSAKRGDR